MSGLQVSKMVSIWDVCKKLLSSAIWSVPSIIPIFEYVINPSQYDSFRTLVAVLYVISIVVLMRSKYVGAWIQVVIFSIVGVFPFSVSSSYAIPVIVAISILGYWGRWEGAIAVLLTVSSVLFPPMLVRQYQHVDSVMSVSFFFIGAFLLGKYLKIYKDKKAIEYQLLEQRRHAEQYRIALKLHDEVCNDLVNMLHMIHFLQNDSMCSSSTSSSTSSSLATKEKDSVDLMDLESLCADTLKKTRLISYHTSDSK